MTMTTIQRCFLTLTLAATMALPAYAYDDQDTHRTMSIIATQKSVLYTDPSILFALGLLPPTHQTFTYYGRAGNVRSGLGYFDVAGLVAEGAYDEDAGKRALQHFYDPLNGRGLRAGPASGLPSWEWMTEPSPIENQDNSLPDARDQLTRALTFREGTPEEAARARAQAIAQMFLSLGHTMHHMQDMAQPQHVRNDQHYDGSGWYFLFASPWYNPSLFEKYTKERNGVVLSLAQSGAPVFPGSDDFKTARDFWSNAVATGIAQKVHRDFVSQGTNFMLDGSNVLTGRYPQPQPGPPADYSIGDLFARSGEAVPPELAALCVTDGADCTMSMYATPVSQLASTVSIFDQDLVARGSVVRYTNDLEPVHTTTFRLFSLNRFNYDDAHPVLVERAVSYSAGIVNHFFRGKLEVRPPARGPYAVVDHAAGEGFKTLTATVTNATPNEVLSGGTIRAIARFHRNGCYKPDLSGEWQRTNGQLAPPCPNWRQEQEVRVSEEHRADFLVGMSQELTFTFSDPIPLDATDLILQVYFTGTVGSEPDSFALGAADVSEPTFAAVMNATDIFELNGEFHYWQDIVTGIKDPPYSAADLDENDKYNLPEDVNVYGSAASLELFINGAMVGTVSAVPEGRFTRLATIVDPAGYEMAFRARSPLFEMYRTFREPAKILQYHPQRRVTLVSPIAPLRGILQYNYIVFFKFHPTHSATVDMLLDSLAPEAAVPIPAQIGSQSAMAVTSASERPTSIDMSIAVHSTPAASPEMVLPEEGTKALPAIQQREQIPRFH